MEKWTITPAPSAGDPLRHRLSIKGDMGDVNKVLKKLGAMCSRPQKADAGFDFYLFLSNMTPPSWDKVTTFLESLGPGQVTRAGAPAAAPAPAPAPAPTPAPAPIVAAPPPVPVFEPPQPAKIETPPPPKVEVPPPPPPPPPQPKPAEPPPAPAPILVAAAPAAPLPGKPLFGSEDKLDEKKTFDTLMVGSYNRFAHAAATSVVGNPGKMYQPLFVFGNPGVGKTHMLHAIGGTLAKNGPAWVTTGASLARAVSRAMQDKKLAELEAHAAKIKSLLIDDVHLLAVTEQNQAALQKLLKIVFDAGSQVVLTSLYPPRALTALEDALKISFAKGWSVDMKMPNPEIQKDMVSGHVDRQEGHGFSQDDVKLFIDKIAAGYYQEFSRYFQRWRVFTKHRVDRGQPAGAYEVLGILFNPGPPTDNSEIPDQTALDAAKSYQPPPAAADAMNMAIFVPKGAEAFVPWLLQRFLQAGQQFLFQRSYRQVLVQSYDPEQPFGVPFQIGEACQRSGAEACLVLGPQSESKLAARVNDFSHAVGHILDSFNIATGFVPHKGSTYAMPMLHAHLDFHVLKP